MATFDFNSLTTGEVAKIEDLSGQSIRTFGDDDAPMGRVLAAMAFVASRRAGEPITWDAAQKLTMAEAQALVGTDDDEATPTGDGGQDAGSEAGDDPKSEPSKPATKRKK